MWTINFVKTIKSYRKIHVSISRIIPHPTLYLQCQRSGNEMGGSKTDFKIHCSVTDPQFMYKFVLIVNIIFHQPEPCHICFAQILLKNETVVNIGWFKPKTLSMIEFQGFAESSITVWKITTYLQKDCWTVSFWAFNLQLPDFLN